MHKFYPPGIDHKIKKSLIDIEKIYMYMIIVFFYIVFYFRNYFLSLLTALFKVTAGLEISVLEGTLSLVLGTTSSDRCIFFVFGRL